MGIMVTLSDGTPVICQTTSDNVQLQCPVTCHRGDLLTADICWGLVVDPQLSPITTLIRQWQPYMMAHAPLYPPADPLHMRLFYDTEGDLAYQEYYDDHLFGQQWTVSCRGIILGLEGVTAPITLTPEELAYYKMRPSSQLHISLALTRDSQAKALGPMIAKANLVTEREPTEVEGVKASPRHPVLHFLKGEYLFNLS